uniref:Uncharacterized protein n=1 Tax=Acrobeloides nanus TaxID=290746 RepID=A0A914CXY9_9BILA
MTRMKYYTIHYRGWNSRWDESISQLDAQDRFIAYTPENIHKAQQAIKKAANKLGSSLSQNVRKIIPHEDTGFKLKLAVMPKIMKLEPKEKNAIEAETDSENESSNEHVAHKRKKIPSSRPKIFKKLKNYNWVEPLENKAREAMQNGKAELKQQFKMACKYMLQKNITFLNKH